MVVGEEDAVKAGAKAVDLENNVLLEAIIDESCLPSSSTLAPFRRILIAQLYLVLCQFFHWW